MIEIDAARDDGDRRRVVRQLRAGQELGLARRGQADDVVGPAKQARFESFEVAIHRPVERVGEGPVVALDLLVRPEAAHVEQQLHAEPAFQREPGAGGDVAAAVDDIEPLLAMEPERGALQRGGIERGREDRRALMVGEGGPADARGIALPAHPIAVLRHSLRLLAAKDGDPVAHSRKADEIGQHLGLPQGVGEAVVGNVEHSSRHAGPPLRAGTAMISTPSSRRA